MAQAQFGTAGGFPVQETKRVIPAEAKQALLTFHGMDAALLTTSAPVGIEVRPDASPTQSGDGRPVSIDRVVPVAGGMVIRNQANLITVSGAVPPKSKVKYLLDDQGRLSRVWLLTEAEYAESNPTPVPLPRPLPGVKPGQKPTDKDDDKGDKP